MLVSSGAARASQCSSGCLPDPPPPVIKPLPTHGAKPCLEQLGLRLRCGLLEALLLAAQDCCCNCSRHTDPG